MKSYILKLKNLLKNSIKYNKTTEKYYSVKNIPLYAIENGYNDIPEACPNCGDDLHNRFNQNGICKCSCGQLVMKRDAKFYFRRNER